MTDHYAISDEHALSIARSIVANLNWSEITSDSQPHRPHEEPLYSPQEMGCIIPADPRKPFDIRKVLCAVLCCTAASQVDTLF